MKPLLEGNQRRNQERGQILVIVGIMMPAILAFMGLVLDSGFIYAENRSAQAASDSIALAAATYMYNNAASTVDCTTATGSGTDTCGVLAYASALGYTATGITVTVTHPAAVSGTYSSTDFHGRGDYVKVEITKTLPKFFIGVVFEGASQPKVTSIAGIARVPMQFALLSLGSPCSDSVNGTSPSQDGGIVVSGSGTLTVNNGAMFSNCTGSPAVNITGSGTIAGDGIQTAGTCLPSTTPCETGLAQISDPMGNIAWPCSSSTTGNNGSSPFCTDYSGSSSIAELDPPGGCSYVLNPGIFDHVSGSCNGTLWLRSGIYVMKGGGFSLSGSAAVKTCDATGAPVGGAPTGGGAKVSDGYGCTGGTGGILIFNATNEYDGARAPTVFSMSTLPNNCNNNSAPSPTSSSISMTGSGGFYISTKSSGPYANLGLWQGCGITSTISLTGSAGSDMRGTLYAPDAPVKLDGSAVWDTPSNIISKFLQMKGSANLTIDYNHSLAYKPYKVVLVQ